MKQGLRAGLSVEEFWRMTPREVQLSIRADAERRLDLYDVSAAAAWQGARAGRMKNFPKLKTVLAERARRRKPRTMEEDIARFQGFFRRLGGTVH